MSPIKVEKIDPRMKEDTVVHTLPDYLNTNINSIQIMYHNKYGENNSKILIIPEHAVQMSDEWARGLMSYPRQNHDRINQQ